MPDIYQLSAKVEHRTTNRTLAVQLKGDHGLKVGDSVQLIVEQSVEEREVVAVDGPDQFVVGNWDRNVEDVFVFGRRVEDLRSLDYDQIFTTGIAAIQEVNRKLDASNKQLQSEVAAVRGENTRLNELLASVMQRLESLESLTQ